MVNFLLLALGEVYFYRECHPPGLSLLPPSSGTTGVRNLNLLGQIYSLGPSGVVFCMRAGGKIPPFGAWSG